MLPVAKNAPLVYVTDNYENAVFVYPAGVDNPAPIGEITDGISEPFGTCVDRRGTLYVTNYQSGSVTEYPRGATSPSITLAKGITQPGACAVDHSGVLAVTDGQQIVEYRPGHLTPSLRFKKVNPANLIFDRSDRLSITWNIIKGSGNVFFGRVSRCERRYCHPLSIHLKGGTGGLAIDHSGNLLLGNNNTGTIGIYPPGSASPSRTIDTPYATGTFALDHEEKTIYVTDPADGLVGLFDYRSGLLIGTISNGLENTGSVSLSPAATLGP